MPPAKLKPRLQWVVIDELLLSCNVSMTFMIFFTSVSFFFNVEENLYLTMDMDSQRTLQPRRPPKQRKPDALTTTSQIF